MSCTNLTRLFAAVDVDVQISHQHVHPFLNSTCVCPSFQKAIVGAVGTVEKKT